MNTFFRYELFNNWIFKLHHLFISSRWCCDVQKLYYRTEHTA